MYSTTRLYLAGMVTLAVTSPAMGSQLAGLLFLLIVVLCVAYSMHETKDHL